MKPDKIRYLALSLMVPVGVLCAATLSVGELKSGLAHGPIQSGHEDVACVQCHIPPDATWRQQVQANVRYVIGQREEPVDFGYHEVDSDACLGCHERPNERHPIYRFREPRFHEATDTVDATSCLGCHSEHTDERSFASLDYCRACHEDLKLKSDPLDIPHTTLIAEANWNSCLGCHDFHGNHVFEEPTRIEAAFPVDEVRAYLADGPSPYGNQKQYEARTE